ncbi:MAG: hypothetical protein OSJ83_07580 [Clostridia bacterium]|nr:hypothetical protein [Clostridia bacterium]
MKIKINVTSIGAAVTFILSLVAIILFSVAYNGCYGYFEMQYPALPAVIGFGITAMLLSAAVIILPMIKAEGVAKKIIDIATDVCIVLVCVFICLALVFAAKSSVYEMALTWGSELHINEPYMLSVCSNALASIIICVVAMLIMGVSACITKKIYAK